VATLVHEIWEEITSDGKAFHTCCLAGTMGDGCRRTLGPKARLLMTFEADSHFEAMTIYNRHLKREPYTTDQASDYDAYPDNWLGKQRHEHY
jgi:hypothetical protein